MIRNLRIYRATGVDPFENLAIEEYLLQTTPADSCTLYLWQNQNTVVIGQNQNPWAECRVNLLESENGKLSRRLSGGGAVFHDLGNLNFTFLTAQDNYDLDKQLSVIQRACAMSGITAVKSGRNDLLADGRKFSGNAFFHRQGKSYHHGTLLINADMERLQRYLSPPKAKLESKGISSVRSRVVNLQELSPELDIAKMKNYMEAAFAEVYGLSPQVIAIEDPDQVETIRQRISSWDYRFGKALAFSVEYNAHFSWGHVQLQLQASGGVVEHVKVYSDAMDWMLPSSIEQALTGCQFTMDAMAQSLDHCLEPLYARDLRQMLQEQG